MATKAKVLETWEAFKYALIEAHKEPWDVGEYLHLGMDMDNVRALIKEQSPYMNSSFGMQLNGIDIENEKYWNEMKGPGYDGFK